MSEVEQVTSVELVKETNSNETQVDQTNQSVSILTDEVINLTSISTKSESISSLSSIDTLNTTNNLIESLQSTKIIDEEKDKTAAAADTTTDTTTNTTTTNTTTTNTTTTTITTADQQPKLIIKQIDPETLNTTIISQKLPKSVASKTNFYNDLSQQIVDPLSPGSPDSNISVSSALPKKAIKFTVRKVSHETIISPTSSPNLSNTGAYGKQRTTSHSNSHSHSHSRSDSHPEIGSTTFTAKSISPMENEHNKHDMDKLKKAQNKYEQYGARITKIDKEINFLAQLLPPYNVEVDYNTRVKITRAIDKLRMKQDEIDKKKYDLGITISRLWRHLDDGSNIWVRKGE